MSPFETNLNHRLYCTFNQNWSVDQNLHTNYKDQTHKNVITAQKFLRKNMTCNRYDDKDNGWLMSQVGWHLKNDSRSLFEQLAVLVHTKSFSEFPNRFFMVQYFSSINYLIISIHVALFLTSFYEKVNKVDHWRDTLWLLQFSK